MRFRDREPEYVRGELKPKCAPDSMHSLILAMLVELLMPLRNRYRLQTRVENRCRLASDVFRIPDLALFGPEPVEAIPAQPPMMVAEVVARDERVNDMLESLRDYAAWSAPHIWIINPWARRFAVWRDDAEVPVGKLTLPEYGFELRRQEFIAALPLEEVR